MMPIGKLFKVLIQGFRRPSSCGSSCRWSCDDKISFTPGVISLLWDQQKSAVLSEQILKMMFSFKD